MAVAETEKKIILERTYIIPLRRVWVRVPAHKRASRAITAIRDFLVRHMKATPENIKLGRWLNEQIWHQGIRRPPHKIKIKATKDESGIVKAELIELSEKAKRIEAKEKTREEETKKKEEKKEKVEEKKGEKEEKKTEEKKEEKEEKEKEEKILRKEITKPVAHEKTKPKEKHEKGAKFFRQALEK